MSSASISRAKVLPKRNTGTAEPLTWLGLLMSLVPLYAHDAGRPELRSVLVVSNFIALQSFISQSTAHPSPVAGIDIADDDFHLFCAAFALRRRTAQRFPIGASKASQHPP